MGEEVVRALRGVSLQIHRNGSSPSWGLVVVANPR